MFQHLVTHTKTNTAITNTFNECPATSCCLSCIQGLALVKRLPRLKIIDFREWRHMERGLTCLPLIGDRGCLNLKQATQIIWTHIVR